VPQMDSVRVQIVKDKQDELLADSHCIAYGR